MGKGHGTPKAVILGLLGFEPETIDPTCIKDEISQVESRSSLNLLGERAVKFDLSKDIIFDFETQPKLHPNGMTLSAYDKDGGLLRRQSYYSTGGGFIASKRQMENPVENDLLASSITVPFPFGSAAELLDICADQGKSIAEIIYANEDAMRPREQTDAALDRIKDVMMACIDIK